jgi:hypothetical protein
MKRLFFLLLIIPASAASLPAVDFWQHPQAAEKNSVFVNALMPSVSFAKGFSLPPPQIGLDYMLPIPLPFSAGIFLKIPWPDMESFGVRMAYHVNLGDRKTDLYILHVVGFALSKGGPLGRHTVVTVRFLDFRLGVRYLFGRYVCLLIETDFLFRGVSLGVSLKLF